jgi:hypothetical protein
MAEDADRFRRSAERCRSLALEARDQIARDELNDIAAELDAEADKIDAEGSACGRAAS